MKMTMMSILALAFSMAACNNAESTGAHDADAGHTEHHGEDGHMHSQNDENQMHSEGSGQPSGDEMRETNMNEEMARNLTSTYLELKDALVKSDAKAANSAAQEITSQLQDTEDELGREIKSAAQSLADADDIEQQRKHFESLSTNLYQLVSQVEMGQDLYWQHCPMAMDNQGANWISDSKEIRNPYFGDRMLKCGRVEEEI